MQQNKILFYLPIISSGGAERVTINIIRELDKAKSKVYLLVNNLENEAYLDTIPKSVKLINMKRNSTLSSFYQVYRIIKDIKPDLVYSTLFRSSVLLDIILRFIPQKPFVLLRNPTSPKYIIEKGNIHPFLKRMVDIAYNRADLVLAQTPQMREELIQYNDVDSEKVEVLVNPVDKAAIQTAIEGEENPFNQENINVVVAGRLHHDKGFDILIQSFKKVVEQDKRFHLSILGNDVGEGEMLYALRKDLGLESYIDFLGFQKNPYKFFNFCDLYVLSSRVEGLPNTVLENIYLKKPIVATACTPFIHSLIQNNKNGFIVDTEDVDELARAILKFKEINVSEKGLDETIDINEFFEAKVTQKKREI